MLTNDPAVWASDATRLARANLCRLIEPGDLLGSLTVSVLGAEPTLHLICSGREPTTTEQQNVGEAAESSGVTARQRKLSEALSRWRTRLPQLGDTQMLQSLVRRGAGLIIPEDTAWPSQLDDLGAARPLALWFRLSAEHPDPYSEAAHRWPHPGRIVALVGSREMTDYGGRIAWDTAAELARSGVCVISGGAYGVDAAAHRGSMAGAAADSWPALAVLAGGVDRFYPAGNEQLLHSILDHGLVLSEVAPGSAPTRHRFLQRNRVIAALSSAVVVVEARWRSGALSTAHRALDIGRPVGAVPGSVLSASSAGCHRLLRDTPTQVVTDAAEIMELVAAQNTVTVREDSAPTTALQRGRPEPEQISAMDGLSDVERLIYDALPVRRVTTPSRLSQVAGLPIPQIFGGLTRLQRKHLVRRTQGGWGRTTSNRATH